MNQRLSAEQTRLYNEFYNMDLAISKLQSDASVISQIGPLDASGSSSGGSGPGLHSHQQFRRVVQYRIKFQFQRGMMFRPRQQNHLNRKEAKGNDHVSTGATATLSPQSKRPRRKSCNGCSSRRPCDRRTARRVLAARRDEEALAAIIHSQKVLGEMLAAIDRDAGGELANRVSSLYEFIFRSLVKAGHRRDENSLHDAVRIPGDRTRDLAAIVREDRHGSRPARPRRALRPIRAPVANEAMDFAGGFSLEA